MNEEFLPKKSNEETLQADADQVVDAAEPRDPACLDETSGTFGDQVQIIEDENKFYNP